MRLHYNNHDNNSLRAKLGMTKTSEKSGRGLHQDRTGQQSLVLTMVYNEPRANADESRRATRRVRIQLPARPRKPLRFVHTSDVHLETDTFGATDAGVKLRDKVRKAFSNVIEVANNRDADLLLIVGDLFDSSRVSEEGLAFAFGTIARAKMPVVMIPGNHDAHDERSIYAKLSPSVFPPNCI